MAIIGYYNYQTFVIVKFITIISCESPNEIIKESVYLPCPSLVSGVVTASMHLYSALHKVYLFIYLRKDTQ